jgi:hypothetical protein
MPNSSINKILRIRRMSGFPIWFSGRNYVPAFVVQRFSLLYQSTAVQPNQNNDPATDTAHTYWTIYSTGGNTVTSVSAGSGITVTGGGGSSPIIAANLVGGAGISIGAGGPPNSLSIANTGVQNVTAAVGCVVGGTATAPTIGTNLTAGGGISVIPGVGTTVAISNTGITAVTAGGAGIAANTVSGNTTINNTGVTSVIAGSNITVSAATGAVTISSTAGGFTPTSQVLVAQRDFLTGQSTFMPNPVGEGLYCILGCSTSTITQLTEYAQFSVMAYVNSFGNIQMGGSGLAAGNGNNTQPVLVPVEGSNQLFFQNNQANTLSQFSIVAIKITGPVAGCF